MWVKIVISHLIDYIHNVKHVYIMIVFVVVLFSVSLLAARLGLELVFINTYYKLNLQTISNVKTSICVSYGEY